jgi:hypothetical protein
VIGFFICIGIVYLGAKIGSKIDKKLEECEEFPPHPPHPPPYSQYSVKLVNECPVTVFFAAMGPNPAAQPSSGESWKADPGESITVRIPGTWLHTSSNHHRTPLGPRFWARTGCKYDATLEKAQCETGDCGNNYDCGAKFLAGKAPVTIAEFCFECGDQFTYYDISLVDGYSISVDVLPGAHSAVRPGGVPNDGFWCNTGLCNSKTDLRTTCPESFLLTNANLSTHNPSDPVNKIACFSNCGKYEYPVAPLPSCSDDDIVCKNWRQYCCQASTYGKTCTTSADCTDGGACWNGTCECKAYFSHPPCSTTICTNQMAQPPAGTCTDCVGDDILHDVCPRAYTWPNDPQTYSCDATEYDIIFCPGGTEQPVTPQLLIPTCASLDPNRYDWQTAQTDCSESHGKYLCAVTKDHNPNIWACNVDQTSCNDVLCSWS